MIDYREKCKGVFSGNPVEVVEYKGSWRVSEEEGARVSSVAKIWKWVFVGVGLSIVLGLLAKSWVLFDFLYFVVVVAGVFLSLIAMLASKLRFGDSRGSVEFEKTKVTIEFYNGGLRYVERRKRGLGISGEFCFDELDEVWKCSDTEWHIRGYCLLTEVEYRAGYKYAHKMEEVKCGYYDVLCTTRNDKGVDLDGVFRRWLPDGKIVIVDGSGDSVSVKGYRHVEDGE